MNKRIFRCNNKEIASGRETLLCGIINVTPDSFSDGGKYYQADAAVDRAKQLIEQGAAMLDIGGESTRPGSTYVEVEEEIGRIIPVIERLKNITDIPISVDTWKSDVARAAIAAGADIINDITGFMGDEAMAKTVGESKAGAILMFNSVIARPEHKGSKIFPTFNKSEVFTRDELEAFSSMDIEDIMYAYLKKSIERAHSCDISDDRIMLDPGIGFGLTKRENLVLIDRIDNMHKLGYELFLGVSRKRFVSNIVSEAGFDLNANSAEGEDIRDTASAVLTAIAALKGVEVLRVHTIKEHLIAASVADAVRLSESMENINFKAYK